MKNTSTLLLCLFSLVLSAQKVIEKNFDYTGQFIDLDVKFAEDIEVKTWNKNTVYFKATVELKEEQFMDKYDVYFKPSSKNILIEEKAEDLFKAIHDFARKNGNQRNRYWINSAELCRLSYVLYVPKNAQFKVSSINGHMKADTIEGKFTADLINGNIDIKNYSGRLDLTTVNGEIDVKVSNSSFTAETVHGDIYADEKLDLIASDRHVGQKIKSNGDGFKNQLSLSTVNGNMYLRK